MLLVGILVKVEVAVALIELALLAAKEVGSQSFFLKSQCLPFWDCNKLQLLNPPESSESVSPLVDKTLEGGVDDLVTHVGKEGLSWRLFLSRVQRCAICNVKLFSYCSLFFQGNSD